MTAATQMGKETKKEVLEGFLLTCERPKSRGRVGTLWLELLVTKQHVCKAPHYLPDGESR